MKFIIATALLTMSNATPTQFVQSFYDWYVVKTKQGADVRGMETALKQKKQLFDTSLYKALSDDEAASAKSPGEIVGLDFDPFVSSNGSVADKYVARLAAKKGSLFRVPVFEITNGKISAKPVLEAEVTPKNGGYVFSNFHYRQTDIPENNDLVKVLGALRKSRAKSP